MDELFALAQAELSNGDTHAALNTLLPILEMECQDRAFYRVYQFAERLAIDLEQFELAKRFFMNQPQEIYPEIPWYRGKDNPAIDAGFNLPPITCKDNDDSQPLECDVPKVSLYMPAYNAEKYIIAAIQSCLEQDFDDLEICICNDGSTDNTLNLLEQHFANHPKVHWISQANAGIANATNQAIALCRGMYIGQIDSDDLLKQGAVRECVAVLDNQSVDAVYTDSEYIDAEGNFIRNVYCNGNFSREWLLTGMIVTHFRMFRRCIWSRISGCNETFENAVDYDLWLKIAEVADIQHIHKPLYGYRWHGNNTSIIKRVSQEQNFLRAIGNSLDRLKLSEFWEVQSTGNIIDRWEVRIFARIIV